MHRARPAAETSYTLAGIALLRSPAQPVHRAEETYADLEGEAEAARSVAYLRGLAADPQFREAVAVSSPALAARWHLILAGEACGLAELRRAVRALTRYRLRMATRCTPFGLMAGVTAVGFADTPQDSVVRLGGAHRRAVRAERDWLTALVQPWGRRPEVLRNLRVVANNLCVVRGDRVLLPYVPTAETDGAASGPGVREVSVRHTEAVRAALEAARTPCRYEELEQQLATLLPAAPPGAIGRLLGQLVAKELLLTELRPPAETTDATAHILATLAPVVRTDLPELAELHGISEALARYADQPLGAGLDAWETVTARMRRLQPRDRLVHVDLALDAEVSLPPEVGAEAMRAAGLLWRLSPRRPVSPALDRYHQRFLARYGTGRAVPVTEVLDPAVGLGAPEGYDGNPAPPAEADPGDAERDRLLLELAQEAALSGVAEVVLGETHPLLLHAVHDLPPRSVELAVQLLAPSERALRAGEFRLVVLGGSPSPVVTTFGRFAHLLPSEQHTRVAELAKAERELGHTPGALHAQLSYQSRNGRGDNVAQVPQWLDHRMPVGVFADTEAPGTLALADLALAADPQRLFIVDAASGREVVPAVFHRLNPRALAPAAARLLAETAHVGVRGGHTWDWGKAAALPYLPRVCAGRSILALARWCPPREVLDQRAPFEEWVQTLGQWRRRWRVPARICLCFLDQRLELNLDQALHLRLLRHELGRRPSAFLEELADPDGTDGGWLGGPGGGHRNELVIPLLAAAPNRERAPSSERSPARPPVPRRTAPAEHLPGGEWLYVKLSCAAEHHNELLARRLPALVADLPPEVDRWFFLRYADPQPQLRLRFHGTPAVLTAGLLPRLHHWAGDLRARRLIRGLALDTYDPELERYGGPEAIAAAERAFHADSLAAVEALARAESGQLALEPALLSAVATAHLAQTFWTAHTDDPDAWADWLLTAVPRDEHHRAFQRHRREALALVDPYGGWARLAARPGGRELLAGWQRRADAYVRYAHRLRELGERSWSDPSNVLLSLLHMRHNRLIGTDRATEQDALAIARGAVAAHRERLRRTT
ncbi:lantibiotic dehydratase [Kitasatospora kifunensis]|uniref:Thiopeptide-type bacteriocin biosynthesis protein n=1 Tax=Kitasatospora kifunensis TaxID=58351 RepID=A0A7W7R9W2_KITKI|nr:lantibiotic dehydratase [Kitasatospora kifunensis]MBB4927935.1 thiopeptide-type bacteriocin biosynthesis protein [Kitasatospora kifunensis]